MNVIHKPMMVSKMEVEGSEAGGKKNAVGYYVT